jgi:hypothetical protein
MTEVEDDAAAAQPLVSDTVAFLHRARRGDRWPRQQLEGLPE